MSAGEDIGEKGDSRASYLSGLLRHTYIPHRRSHTLEIAREARPRETSPKHKDVAAHYMESVCVEVSIMRGGKGTKDD